MFTYEFPRPALTVDLIAFSIDQSTLKILLIRRASAPFKGKWTLPGGFVHDQEPLELSAARILNDKANINDVYTEQLYTFAAPKRDPRDRIISIAYFAILPPGFNYLGPGTWHDVEALPNMGFDHNDIASMAIARLRSKLKYSDIGLEFAPNEFTLSELQYIWQSILNEVLDKRNFRKAILKTNLLIETGKKSTGGAHPPAKIYKKH